MSLTPDEYQQREGKLPQWAQQSLIALRSENRRLRQALERDGDPTSNTFANDYGHYAVVAPRQRLGRGTKISFYATEDTDDYNTRVDVWQGEDGWVQVYGGRSLEILPESGNTIRLRSV